MPNKLIRIFDEYADAEGARDALLQAGYDKDAVRVSVRDDEAGPVEGNFAVGNAMPDEDKTYARNFEKPAQRGTVMVEVSAADRASIDAASKVLEDFGGRDIDALTP
ncbi:hypothetical protein [Massilia cavernae]|uniref:Uncharacterized protein n=1 Tax=Massilia cavernae TaxID=2320864 RepID=A0A418Y845_9BURK|nr:hypothetical protein [Massilia cavernae]RJG27464.1 hypothetical protein D3872_01020 [Massilia cavernae]